MTYLPNRFVERYLEKAKGARFFGVEIEKLEKDDLIAMAVAGWEAVEENRKQKWDHIHRGCRRK